MELTGAFAVGVANFCLSAYKQISDKTAAHDDDISSAIVALSKAIIETQIYLRDLTNGEKSDKLKEAEVARLWEAAAEPVRGVDRTLSDLCRYKAKYWLFPERYSEEDIIGTNITLIGMEAQLQNLRNL